MFQIMPGSLSTPSPTREARHRVFINAFVDRLEYSSSHITERLHKVRLGYQSFTSPSRDL